MKTFAITFRLMISFLLLAITTSGAAGENEAVLDFYGNTVKANTPYHVRGSPLGIVISMYRNDQAFMQKCVEGVKFSQSSEPIYVVFVSSSDDVRVSTELNIKFTIPKFSKKSPCSKSMFWKVGEKYTEEEYLVVLEGSELSYDSMFTIEKSDDRYKFAFRGVNIGTGFDIFSRLKLLTDPRLADFPATFSFYPVSE